MWVLYAIFAFLFGLAVLFFMGALIVTAGQIIWRWCRSLRERR